MTLQNEMTLSFQRNLVGLIRTMRLRQWSKNVVIYAGLVFDGRLFQWDQLFYTTLVVFCFCLISSSVYIINDLFDIEKDRMHPRKRTRPLPSGELDIRLAVVAAFLLAVSGIGAASLLNPWVGAVTGVYLLQNVAYSLYLKNIVIVDVMVLSLGFLLRVLAGVLIANVSNFSPWLYVCMGLLSLFLGFGKRRHEITLLQDDAAAHRSSLQEYNLPLLDQIMSLVTTSTFVAYTFYSFEAQTALVRDGRMLLTTPFVFFAIVRYLYLIHVKKKGGAPDELIFEDRALLLDGLLWVITVVVLIYLW
ncbi:MAG TPA: decaprenyl-phosphate phosphoribosyltransferase [Caldilineaceae bacterium]|nr:decaprenyl-phosphate phosphoribosyltransferase [Caldilineaceae bacterium]MCB0187800.1 decaprenyl-phosphate phosphoribosyltransferase [Caldilineaceae bacterium]HRW05964.1 decaprenyl-phosphate phosphoribosyltransferase [Caldilineaceae bacterium]